MKQRNPIEVFVDRVKAKIHCICIKRDCEKCKNCVNERDYWWCKFNFK